jgi:hypothetical protein
MPLVPADSIRRAGQWASNPLAMCLNPKVLAGLAVLAVGLFVFQPRLLSVALPVLLVAACPLSMAAMMWGMRRSSGSRTPASSTLPPKARLEELQAELVRVKTERAQLSAELHPAQSGPVLPINTQEGLGQKAEQAPAPPV